MSHPRASQASIAADQELARLVEELTSRRQQGVPIDVEQLAAEHPAYANQLRHLLPALELLADVSRGGLSWSALGPPPSDGPAGVLGDFRIVREIGRGGMGVVYEAEQLSLGRRVALKVLPFATALDARRRQRFANEVHAAALLHHTHIVPIFAVGCERGVHFYAMQFIDGQNLAVVIRDLRERPGDRESPPVADEPTHPLAVLTTVRSTTNPAYFESVARLGMQAAEALEHAHALGVVHRDVKPANLLVDVRGHLWVTDFGLARLPEETGLTVTGDLVGTLRYMSPEQAQGRPLGIDHRTDVYSLGTVLYELLALQPVCSAEDRATLLRQIIEEEPRPPRQFNRSVPVELETIVLTALAKSPADRYASSQELADDLRRFLEDKPIRARRPTLRQRLGRWGRRHRSAVVAAVGAALAIVLVSLVGLVIGTLAILGERDRARTAERDRTRQLFGALIAQAEATREGGRLGSRIDGLEALEEAARIAPGLEIDDPQRLKLRNEIIASLALDDVRIVQEWQVESPSSGAVAFDADLHRYAFGDNNGDVHVIRVADQQELARLDRQAAGELTALRFSPCGRFLAVSRQAGGGPTATVWDLDRQVIRQTIQGGGRVDFSPDSRTVAVATRSDVQIWDVELGRKVGSLASQLPRSRSRTVAFNPRGTWLAVWNVEGEEVEVWSVPLGSRLWRFALPRQTDLLGGDLPAMVNVVAWHPVRPVVAVGSGREIYVWDLEFARVLDVLKGHQGGVVGVGYAASGDQLLTTSWDGTTRLWDPRSGRQLAEMPASPTTHTSSVSRDGRRFAVCNGRRMAIVQTERSPEYRTLYYRGEETAVSDLAIDPTSRLVVAGGLQGLRSWDLSTGSATGWFQVGPLFQIIFPGDGRELVTCGLMGVHRWPLSPGPSDGTLRAGPPAPEPSLGIGWHTAALCQDGRLLAIVNAAQHEVVLFDTRAGTVKLRLSGQLNVRTAHISPDGRWIATGSQHGEDARVWSTDDGRVVCRVPHPAGTSSRVTFSPDGSRLLVSLGSEYVLLESGTWQVSRRFPRDYAGDMPGPAAFSPDCRLLTVTRTPQLVQLLDPDTGAEVATLLAPQASLLETLKFSADGNWLAAGSSAVHVWNLRRIRVHLATLGLDWGPGPPDGEPSHSPLPRLELVPGEMADVPRWITYYRWVLKSTPDNATACNNLAWSYATGPVPVRDLTAALKLAEKAVRIKPHRDYLNTLGVVYYRLGRYAEAVTTFERAIGSTTEPVPAHDLFFLAMCFQQLGETEKARMTYQEALVAMERQPSYEEELRGFRAEAEQLIRP